MAAAAVGSTATVESATAVETSPTAACESTPVAATEPTAYRASAHRSTAGKPASPGKRGTAASKPATKCSAASIKSESATSPETEAPAEAAEPWPSANKEAPIEPIRSVVAVRRASIGIIAIVAISANGRRVVAVIARANSDSHPNLRLGRRDRHKSEQYQQRKIL